MAKYISFNILLLTLLSTSAFIIRSDPNTRINTDEKIIFDICYSPNGQALIVADGTSIKWFSTDNYSLLSTSSNGHKKRIMTIDLSNDSTLLATGSIDSSIVIWDVGKNIIQKRLDYHKGIVTSVNFSPDGNYMISGGTDNKVFLYDIKNQKIKQSFSDHTDDITSVAIGPDQLTFCTAGGDGVIILYDFDKGTIIKSFSSNNWIREISYCNDGSKIISCGDDSKTRIWNIKNPANIKELNNSKSIQNWILTAKFHEYGKSYAIGGINGVARISTPYGGYSTKVGVAINDIEFKPRNGNYLKVALATNGKGVLIYDAKNMRIKKK